MATLPRVTADDLLGADAKIHYDGATDGPGPDPTPGGDDLCTIADVRNRLEVDLPPSAEARVRLLIADASASVRIETRQRITRATYTTKLKVLSLNNGQRVVRVPQKPVVSVADVTDLAGEKLDYEWDGDTLIYVKSSDRYIKVTYTAGYGDDNDPTQIRKAVAGIVANVAARAYGSPAESAGKTQEVIGGYSYQTGAATASGTLMAGEKAKVRRLIGMRPGTTIETS